MNPVLSHSISLSDSDYLFCPSMLPFRIPAELLDLFPQTARFWQAPALSSFVSGAVSIFNR
jgi:hypothetical protein